MIPRIFEIGPIPINSFGLMIAAAVFAGSILLAKSFKINGINPDFAEKYAFSGVIFGLLGARLWYVFIDFYDQVKDNLLEALLSTAGFTFYGGFIFSAIVLVVMSKKDKIPFASFLDSFGPAMTLGYAIGRLGCQLSGDGDYGVVTKSFLGMSYSTGVIPTDPGVLVFPTPLYESILAFLILFVLLKVEKRKGFFDVPYKRFTTYLCLISLERFAIEFLRVNPKLINILGVGISQAQIISLSIFALSLIVFFASSKIFLRNTFVFLLMLFPFCRASAGGYAILEQSAEGVGKAFAGASAGYGDGSEVAFNPAAMSWIGRDTISVNFHLLDVSANFNDTGSTNVLSGEGISGGNGKDGGDLLSVPNFYFVSPVSDSLTYGFGLNSPFGLKTEYSSDWVGRYHALKSELVNVNLINSLAYKLNDNFSVGGAVNFTYNDATLSNAIDFKTIGSSLSLPDIPSSGTDGVAEITGDDWGVGWNAGMLYQYAEGRLGFSYHSKVKLDFDAQADFLVPDFATSLQALDLFTNTSSEVGLVLPEYINLAWNHKLTDDITFLSEAQWTRWSRFEELRIGFSNAMSDKVIEESWKDVWRYSLALDYQACNDLSFSLGVMFDESPVAGAEYRTPSIPDSDRKWLTLGAKYAVSENAKLVFSYAHIFTDDALVDIVDTTGHNLKGDFDTVVDIFSLGLVWGF